MNSPERHFTPFRHGSRTLLDGALVNPVPISPTLQDGTDLTVVVNLSGTARPPALPPASTAVMSDNGYRRRIARFIDGLQAGRVPAEPRPGLLDVAFMSMQAMQDTISQLRLSGSLPDVTVEIPSNACGFFEFWRAQELIDLGRERAAQAFARRDQ